MPNSMHVQDLDYRVSTQVLEIKPTGGLHLPTTEREATLYFAGGALRVATIEGESAAGITGTVVYAGSWPVARPPFQSVLAVGGPSEPAWLTAKDLWFEEV